MHHIDEQELLAKTKARVNNAYSQKMDIADCPA